VFDLRPYAADLPIRGDGSAMINRRGFTLVELLVVIAIIGLLIALLLPAVQSTRESARRTQCTNNLKQITLGLHTHESSRQQFPSRINSFTPRSSWLIQLLPFIEQQPLYDEIQRGVLENGTQTLPDGPMPWQGAFSTGARFAPFWRTLDAFICPSDPASRASAPAATMLGRNNYRACAGDRPEHDLQAQSKRGMFSGWLVNRTAAHVKDGLSNTVACGEVCVASGNSSIRGSMAVGWGVGNAATAPLTSMIPQTCAARQGSDGQLSGTVDSTMSGSRWSDGVSAFASLHTILPPNAPSCREGNDFMWVVATASSYHPGGANVSMADGSVRFVVESIDTGRLTDSPVNSGRSPYGIWGAMGSIDGKESPSE